MLIQVLMKEMWTRYKMTDTENRESINSSMTVCLRKKLEAVIKP